MEEFLDTYDQNARPQTRPGILYFAIGASMVLVKKVRG